eukprot:gene11293-15115_t
MVAGGASANTLARDTVFSAVMIVCNGVVGLCLVVGGLRHGARRRRDDGLSHGGRLFDVRQRRPPRSAASDRSGPGSERQGYLARRSPGVRALRSRIYRGGEPSHPQD